MPEFIHAIRTVSKHTANEVSVNRWLNVDQVAAIEYDEEQNGVAVLMQDDSVYIVDSTRAYDIDDVLAKEQPERPKPKNYGTTGYIDF